MPEDIILQIHTALIPVAPELLEREKLVAKIGETIWLESLEMLLSKLPEDSERQAVTYLNEDNIEDFITLCEKTDLDPEVIIREVATDVMNDVLKKK